MHRDGIKSSFFFFFLVNGCEEKAVAWRETARCVPLTARYGFGRMFAYSCGGYMFHMCVPADVRMAGLLRSAVVRRGEQQGGGVLQGGRGCPLPLAREEAALGSQKE